MPPLPSGTLLPVVCCGSPPSSDAHPSITAPTVADLYGTEWASVESVISEAVVRDLIPKLVAAGAVGIIEYPLNKVI